MENLDGNDKVLLLFGGGGGGGLALPLDNETNVMINRFISSAVEKIHKLCKESLPELDASWLANR